MEYIERVFRIYTSLLGIGPGDLRGKRVVELGPGDSDGIALRFLAAGAAEVTCIDRFSPSSDPGHARRVRRVLLDRLPEPERGELETLVSEDGCVADSPRLRWITNMGIDQAESVLAPGSYDLIVSCAVLEEVDHLGATFDAMDRALAPGGAMAHIVDLRDYGMFTSAGLHPLTHLTIPDLLYAAAASATSPNRRHVTWYRRKCAQVGHESRIYVTQVVGREPLATPKETLKRGVDYDEQTLALVEQARPKLLRRYRRSPTEDLMLAGIVLVTAKPDRADAAPSELERLGVA